MYRSIKSLFVLLFLILTVSGAFAVENKTRPEIKRIYSHLAVFDFEVTNGDKSLSRPLSESIRREIVLSGKYEVIDRGNMDKILGEHKLQMSGCISGQCIIEAGKLLGVGKIISGTVSLVGKTYYLTLSLIDVETGKIENVSEDKCKCEVDELLDSTKRLAKKLLGEKVDSPVAVAPAPAPAAVSKPASPEPKITNSIGMAFVYIKPGTFIMGSPSGETGRGNDETQHQVTLTRGSYMQTTEVTQGQWQALMGSNPSYFKNCGSDCPVEQVSWNDAQEFIRRLNQKEGVSSYRLPTEAEWEYAARSGGRQEQYAGTDSESNLGDYAWYRGNSGGKTHSVGQKIPNGLGLYDMSGNVWEWCEDRIGNYPSSSVTDPVGPSSGSDRVFRGGSWRRYARICRAAVRVSNTPGYRNGSLGFRLSRTP